jgi:hypothetical protein
MRALSLLIETVRIDAITPATTPAGSPVRPGPVEGRGRRW